MAKLYTKTGDDGTTGLFGGGRVEKDHPRMEAIGAVDELNAAIGWARNATTEARRHRGTKDLDSRLRGNDKGPLSSQSSVLSPQSSLFDSILAALQSRLFDLGADLATPLGSKHENKVARISADDVQEAEQWIDEVDAGNTPMTQFVLPGGTELAARLHLARTICRRAERRMISLGRQEKITSEAIIYVNRVSDLLFAMARRANKEVNVADVPWEKRNQGVSHGRRD